MFFISKVLLYLYIKIKQIKIMKNLQDLLKKENLFSIAGMTTDLGYKTKRCNLKTLKDCEDWLKESNKNFLRLFFENEDFIDFEI